MTLSGQTYTCRAGQTFDSVALMVYENEQYTAELLCANPELANIVVFSGGEVLQLPVVEIVENDDEESDGYMPAKAPWKE